MPMCASAHVASSNIVMKSKIIVPMRVMLLSIEIVLVMTLSGWWI